MKPTGGLASGLFFIPIDNVHNKQYKSTEEFGLTRREISGIIIKLSDEETNPEALTTKSFLKNFRKGIDKDLKL